MTAEEAYQGEHAVIALHSLPPDQRARTKELEDIQNLLVPAFFDGKTTIPAELSEKAQRYRADFRAIVQPGLVRYHIEIAPDWCAWIGIEADP
jgi:hypothetical protein